MRNYLLFLCAAVVLTSLRTDAEIVDLSPAQIIVLNPQQNTAAKAALMLRAEIEKRTRITLWVQPNFPSNQRPAIVIGTAEDLAAKGYRPPVDIQIPKQPDAFGIWIDRTRRQAMTICAAGHDERGTVFAAGRLLRLLEMDRDKLQLEDHTQLATAPKYPLRGHQFGFRPKTNAYDAWTLAMWEQYYRDMMVFGMNAIELIPPRSDDAADSPHFPKAPMEMMIEMSHLAGEYGLDVWIWYPSMEKDYGDPTTMETALKEREAVFKLLPRIDAVFVPGGDPGDVRPTFCSI